MHLYADGALSANFSFLVSQVQEKMGISQTFPLLKISALPLCRRTRYEPAVIYDGRTANGEAYKCFD